MAAVALLRHYAEYFSSPGVLLSLLVVVVPILLSVLAERATAKKEPNSIPDCRRLGLTERSNLQDQFDHLPSQDKGPPRVQALFTYPVKSCRGVELAASEVQASGLRYDRLFTFAQLVSKQVEAGSKAANGVAEQSGDWKHQWRFITQREFPRLALLHTELWLPRPRGRKAATQTKKGNLRSGAESRSPSPQRARSRTRGDTLLGQLEQGGTGGKPSASPEVSSWAANGGCLVIHFPFEPDFNPFGLRTETVTLRLPLAPTVQWSEALRYESEEVVIWKDCPLAINVTNEIDAAALTKLRYFLGVSNPLALFKVDETKKRAVTQSLPKDTPKETYRIGFADGFPVNLLGLTSVRATEKELPKAAAVKGKLDARRFRANVYIAGIPAFAEDTWKKIILGRRVGRDEHGLFEADAEYHVACRTARCKLPNVDQATGVKDGNEPYTTLGKTRRVDEGAYPNPCLGMQSTPRFQLGMIRIGDEVEVLETGEHCYEK
ncbi:hypothetical protein LTR08_004836 [Meristemomyces frigidus]|nr:hypothetical protein LTR08_004836 [Meristemomyces frigidus]